MSLHRNFVPLIATTAVLILSTAAWAVVRYTDNSTSTISSWNTQWVMLKGPTITPTTSTISVTYKAWRTGPKTSYTRLRLTPFNSSASAGIGPQQTLTTTPTNLSGTFTVGPNTSYNLIVEGLTNNGSFSDSPQTTISASNLEISW